MAQPVNAHAGDAANAVDGRDANLKRRFGHPILIACLCAAGVDKLDGFTSLEIQVARIRHQCSVPYVACNPSINARVLMLKRAFFRIPYTIATGLFRLLA